MRNKPLPKISRPSWVWLTWFGAGLLMVSAAGLIYVNERGTRLDAAEAQLLTELTYIEHIVAGSLRAGSLDQIAEQIRAWGQLNEDTLSLRLIADNGYTIAQFTRPGAPIQRAEHSVGIPFSYRDEATLTLEKSLAPVHAQLDRLGLQLLIAAVVFQLFALVLIRQLYEQRRQTQIARHEYERRKRTQAAMERMATQDALTGLPNRRQLEEQLQQRVAESARYQRRLAVLFIDLDNFKHVNDTLGHAVGDDLLKVISSRMQGCLRGYDFLARFGGDEFVVLLSDLHDAAEVKRVASKLLDSIKPGVELADHQTYVSATIGISLFPDDGTEPADLLRHADAAMYTAKSSGRDCYRFFTAALNKAMRQQQIIESGLHKALGANDLYLVYQPKLDIATGKVNSCEALLRWRRDGVEIPPSEFIPVAQRSVLMRQIETFVIAESISQRARWSREGVGELRIDINVSGQGLLVGDALDQLEDALQRYDVAHDQIGIELTEHTLIEATKKTIRGLQQLREHGCAISLDDFGTGYSSLGYLKRLPIDVLKIDRAFIRDLPVSAQDASIVAAICAMGQSLGKRTLAEGVETQAQLDYVEQHGCQLAQGFLICRPIPADELSQWLRRHAGQSSTGVANQP